MLRDAPGPRPEIRERRGHHHAQDSHAPPSGPVGVRGARRTGIRGPGGIARAQHVRGGGEDPSRAADPRPGHGRRRCLGGRSVGVGDVRRRQGMARAAHRRRSPASLRRTGIGRDNRPARSRGAPLDPVAAWSVESSGLRRGPGAHHRAARSPRHAADRARLRDSRTLAGALRPEARVRRRRLGPGGHSGGVVVRLRLRLGRRRHPRVDRGDGLRQRDPWPRRRVPLGGRRGR